MATLEQIIFYKNFKYKPKLMNRCIEIIQTSDDENRVRAYKWFVFILNNKIVRKNILNYKNLLKKNVNFNQDSFSNEELISDCYMVFDVCIKNYNIQQSIERKSNFYFFFNMSLSRKFFTDFRNSLKTSNIELSDAIESKCQGQTHNHINLEFLYETLHMSEIEIRICRSRMNGESKESFLESNIDIDKGMYAKSLTKIKTILQTYL